MNIRTIIRLIDVNTLAAGFFPVLLGTAYAWYRYHAFHLLYLLLLVLAIGLVQSSTNMFNDYMDYQRGADREEKAEEKVLVNGEITPKGLLGLIGAFILTAAAIGIGLAVATGWQILIVAILGGLTAVLYSSGPRPISYTPFGEAASGCVMGIGITATVVFIQAESFHWSDLAMCLPTALFIAYIMFTNNLCDREQDLAAGRKTLPGLLGFALSRKIWLRSAWVLCTAALILVISGIYPVWNTTVIFLLFTMPGLKKIQTEKQSDFQKRIMMPLIGEIGIQFHLWMLAGLLAAGLYERIRMR